MRSLLFSGLALALAATSGVAIAGDSGPRTGGHNPGSRIGGHHQVMPGMNMQHRPNHTMAPRHNWGGKHQGRWVGGWQAPGGWTAYRRPARGYILPSYWVQPSFYIGNYSTYGFSQPQSGYGWSRYYNDAVLTDRYGRVYDSVPNYDWDRYDSGYGYEGDDYSDSYGYDEREYRDDRGDRRYRGKDRDGGLGGALIGGVVGGVAGNIIGGKGNRTAGTLIGAGVGALAGAAIDSGDRAGRGPSRGDRYRTRGDRQIDYGYDYDQASDAVTYQGQWDGTWTGSYNGGPTQVYSGTYGGRFEGQGPHWDRRDVEMRNERQTWGGGATMYPQGGPVVTNHQRQGYGYGYGYGAPAVTTVVIQSAPVVTTTTTTTEYVTEYVNVRKRVAYKAPAKKVWKPKPRCVCR